MGYINVCVVIQTGICRGRDFDCGNGYCTQSSARCDGFKDCPTNYMDELECGMCVGIDTSKQILLFKSN